MTTASASPAVERFVDFVAELGPRWGLPSAPCRVHGYLYLVARPVTEAQLGQALGLESTVVADSLAWLADYRLVDRADDAWRTRSDPWELMLRALEERRRREITPALDLLHECRRAARSDPQPDHSINTQLDKLVALLEDLAAIDMQARRLSPQTLRQLIGFGGRAARVFNRTFNPGAR
jgi:DNA-binding transcriptional regulator GbsR (MarR family)